jgi:SAM-dependent methyltransferase
MIEKARQAIADSGLTNSIELIVCDMEELNLRDSFADVVISNCVINLCADKDVVYSEAFRILKPGGRLAISDIIYIENIDSQVKERFQSTWAGCVGGTIEKEKYFEIIRKAGFSEIGIVATHPLPSKELETMVCCPGPEFTPAPAKEDIDSVQGKVASIKFVAIKPTSN